MDCFHCVHYKARYQVASCDLHNPNFTGRNDVEVNCPQYFSDFVKIPVELEQELMSILTDLFNTAWDNHDFYQAVDQIYRLLCPPQKFWLLRGGEIPVQREDEYSFRSGTVGRFLLPGTPNWFYFFRNRDGSINSLLLSSEEEVVSEMRAKQIELLELEENIDGWEEAEQNLLSWRRDISLRKHQMAEILSRTTDVEERERLEAEYLELSTTNTKLMFCVSMYFEQLKERAGNRLAEVQQAIMEKNVDALIELNMPFEETSIYWKFFPRGP